MTRASNFFEKNIPKFLKVYANVPVNLRREIILVIEDEPITWNTAYVEIINRTELGKKILKKLIEFNFI